MKGGKREGAGRKRSVRQYGDAFRLELSKTLEKKRLETGKSLQDVLVDMVYDEGAQQAARVGALKQAIDVLVPKESHRTIEETKRVVGPVILPQRKKDPAEEDVRH